MLKLSGKTKDELIKIASSENTTSMDRYILAGAEFSEVLEVLLKRRNLYDEIIEAIVNNSKSKSSEIITLIASHKNTPQESLQKILDESTSKDGNKKFSSIILQHTSPEKLEELKSEDESVQQLIQLAMVESTGLPREKLEKIYEELSEVEKQEKFNKLFANNPFSGSEILSNIAKNTKDTEIILAIAANRSAGDDLLNNILKNAKSKDIDIANALIGNSGTSKELGEEIYAKFEKNLDSETVTSMIKRNLSLFSEKTLAKIFNKTEAKDEQQKITRLLDKNDSVYRLILPSKTIQEKRRWIISRSSLEDLKDFAVSYPEAEEMLINYWSKISEREGAQENSEKMKTLFSETLWKGKAFSDYKKIVNETKNTEVVRAVISAQDSFETKEELLLFKIKSLPEDQILSKIKNLATVVKNADTIDFEEFKKELQAIVEKTEEMNLKNKDEVVIEINFMTHGALPLRKKRTLANLSKVWDTVFAVKPKEDFPEIKKEDKPSGENDIFYIRMYSQLYEIASQINSKEAMGAAVESMSHRERMAKLKEMFLFSAEDRENISLLIDKSLPEFTGAIKGTAEKTKEHNQILEIEREVLRTEDKDYISIIESKRCFVTPVTEKGIEKKKSEFGKFLAKGFLKLSDEEKDEFIGPMLEQYTGRTIKDFREDELKDLMSHTEDVFGVQKMKKVFLYVVENKNSMTMKMAKQILNKTDFPFPGKKQKMNFENSILRKLLEWDSTGEVESIATQTKYGDILGVKVEISKPEQPEQPEKINSILVEDSNHIKEDKSTTIDSVLGKQSSIFDFIGQNEDAYLKMGSS